MTEKKTSSVLVPVNSDTRALVAKQRMAVATKQFQKAMAVGAKSKPVAITGRVVVGTTKVAGKATVGGTRRSGKFLYILGAGMQSWMKRAVKGATHGHDRQGLLLSEAAGDLEGAGKWADRLDRDKNDRIKRLLELPKAIASAILAVVVGLIALFILNFLVSVAVWMQPGGWTFTEWWTFVGKVLDWTGIVIQWTALAACCLAPVALVVAMYREGKRAGIAPLWLMSPAEAAIYGAEITPHKAVMALRDLGIKALRDHIEAMTMTQEGSGGMLSPIRIAGCGMEWDAKLPSGVSTEDILSRRRKVAENLDRHEHELFMSVPAPRTIRFWAADPGVLDQPIGASPLAVDETMTADIYTGRAPWGQTMRGDAAAISLHQRHVLVTGQSNQGKTAAIRALALWAALDVTTELRIADLKGIGDWNMFSPIASRLIQGPSDDQVVAATEMLEDGLREMHRRLAGFDKDENPNGVGRDLARKKGSGFHPLILIVDEAQVAFMSPVVGDDKRPFGGTKRESRFFNAARQILNQGRAVNVTLWLGTQDPTDQNLPKLIREQAHIRASLAIGTESQARMALGDKAVDGGGAPHQLRQGLDKGTLVATPDGMDVEAGTSAVIVRTHFIDGDAAIPIVKRAATAREKAGRVIVVDAEIVEDETVDFLADVDELMNGGDRINTTLLLHGLAGENPGTYGRDDAKTLAERLRAHGIEPKKIGGKMYVLREQLDAAFRARDEVTV